MRQEEVKQNSNVVRLSIQSSQAKGTRHFTYCQILYYYVLYLHVCIFYE